MDTASSNSTENTQRDTVERDSGDARRAEIGRQGRYKSNFSIRDLLTGIAE